MTPRLWHLPVPIAGGWFRIGIAEWGDRDAPPAICVHGLTRNARDFDPLARALARTHRVLCPDLPGRGRSDWLPEPALYVAPTYVGVLTHVIAACAAPVAWIGTSLGGICGMLIAAQDRAPITRLVLNDVGSLIPAAALSRIAATLAGGARFANLLAVEAHLRRIHVPFGDLSDEHWVHLAQHSSREMADGTLALHYDPAIALPFGSAPAEDIDLSAAWSRVAAPTLVIRGAHSDLLLEATLQDMALKAETFTVGDAGHAPALADAETIGRIVEFLK